MDIEASFWNVMESRSSIRKYKKEPVPREMLEKIVNTEKNASFIDDDDAIHCTIVSNPEKVQYIAREVKRIGTEKIQAIDDESLRKNTLSYSSSFFWFGKAPALLALSCRKSPECIKFLNKRHPDDLFGARTESAMAAQNIMLAATAMGLGTCCLTGPLVAKSWLEAELGCPDHHELVLLISVGFGIKD